MVVALSGVPSRWSADGGRVDFGDGVESVAEACRARFAVHVRVLHALDLVSSELRGEYPIARVSANNGEPQTCTAVQHAKNYSVWRRHALTFDLEASGWFSIQVVVLCGDSGSPSTAREIASTELGSLGELRLPVRAADYELTRFFQLFRRVSVSSAPHRSSAAYTLAPVGRIKLRIQFEVSKPGKPQAILAAKPSTTLGPTSNPSIRPLFGNPISFLENLQLQRKKLKAVVVPVTVPDPDAVGHDSDANSGSDASFFAREIALLPASHIVGTDELQFIDQKAVGEGVHSCVRRAILASTRVSHSGDGRVAVKEFRYLDANSPPRKVVEAFFHEYRVLASLPQRCDSIVAFEGVMLQPRLAIVMELCAHGSIAQLMSDAERWENLSLIEVYLDGMRGAIYHQRSVWLTHTTQRCAIALQLARGIESLHKHNIVHRDIKPHNILLTSDVADGGLFVVKVGDLGSGAFHSTEAPLLTEETGSSGYTAPEVFSGSGYDCKADIWSYAIVLWEIFAPSSRPDNPFIGLDNDEFVRRTSEGFRPDVTHFGDAIGQDSLGMIKKAARRVIEACWAFNPAERPGMSEVVRMVEQMRTMAASSKPSRDG